MPNWWHGPIEPTFAATYPAKPTPAERTADALERIAAVLERVFAPEEPPKAKAPEEYEQDYRGERG